MGVAHGRRGAGAERAGAADIGPVPPAAARRPAGAAARSRRALHRAHARRRLVRTRPTNLIINGPEHCFSSKFAVLKISSHVFNITIFYV